MRHKKVRKSIMADKLVMLSAMAAGFTPPFSGNSEIPLCPVSRANDKAALASANAKIEAARRARIEQRELRRASKALALQS